MSGSVFEEKSMEKILCATRGGDASFITQDKAIQFVHDKGGELVFLYVVDTHFIDKTSAPIVVDVEGEISKMGEFLLLMAVERAQKAGLEARTILREGNVREELTKVIAEEEITLVVLGKPAGDSSVFELDSLMTFAEDLEEETGVKTVIV
jgi:nucleotide-binding universal stress UspA family protein